MPFSFSAIEEWNDTTETALPIKLNIATIQYAELSNPQTSRKTWDNSYDYLTKCSKLTEHDLVKQASAAKIKHDTSAYVSIDNTFSKKITQ
jgi:hypothetical protein